ncbi:21916_t:CDS:10 [Rhizophagus irregularis]|nr:21916_t:CDS:10 [Rhizophagus irregularis]
MFQTKYEFEYAKSRDDNIFNDVKKEIITAKTPEGNDFDIVTEPGYGERATLIMFQEEGTAHYSATENQDQQMQIHVSQLSLAPTTSKNSSEEQTGEDKIEITQELISQQEQPQLIETEESMFVEFWQMTQEQTISYRQKEKNVEEKLFKQEDQKEESETKLDAILERLKKLDELENKLDKLENDLVERIKEVKCHPKTHNKKGYLALCERAEYLLDKAKSADDTLEFLIHHSNLGVMILTAHLINFEDSIKFNQSPFFENIEIDVRCKNELIDQDTITIEIGEIKSSIDEKSICKAYQQLYLRLKILFHTSKILFPEKKIILIGRLFVGGNVNQIRNHIWDKYREEQELLDNSASSSTGATVTPFNHLPPPSIHVPEMRLRFIITIFMDVYPIVVKPDKREKLEEIVTNRKSLRRLWTIIDGMIDKKLRPTPVEGRVY